MGLALATAGCDEASPARSAGDPGPCAAETLALEVAPPGGAYGALVSGSDLEVGIPPQGGAPYTPFRLRLAGPASLVEGLAVEMRAEDLDGAPIARTALVVVPLCSNVGESAGRWLTETHLRWEGSTLADLDGLEVDATVSVLPLDDGAGATAAARVRLVVAP